MLSKRGLSIVVVMLTGALLGAAVASCAGDKPRRRRKATPFPDIIVEGDGSADDNAGKDNAGDNAGDDTRDENGVALQPTERTEDTPDEPETPATDNGAAFNDERLSEPPGTMRQDRDDSRSSLFSAEPGAAGADEVDNDAPMKSAETMRIHVVNVGQGAATLVEFPCGAMLVDTGGEDSGGYDGVKALEKYLDTFFKRRKDLRKKLDVVVITHAHIDHMRGLPVVLDKYKVGAIIDGGRPGDKIVKTEMTALGAFLKKAAGKSPRVVLRSPQIDATGYTSPLLDPFKCKQVDPKITALHGAFASDPGWGKSSWGHPHYENENNHSVAVRIDFGKASYLITGDLEETAIHGLIKKFDGSGLLDVDIYQVGHHGSDNGTTRPLMRAMSPKMALISMGDPNRHFEWTGWQYGHPRRTVIDILQENVSMRRSPAKAMPAGVKMRTFTDVRVDRAIYGTGWDGDIIVEVASDGRIAYRPGAKP